MYQGLQELRSFATPAAPAGRYDWLIVGAGLTGATFARELAERTTARILVVDQRSHVGGNVFDSLDSNGVRVQRYGAHIFHTGSAAIFDYLSRFTEWYQYEHKVLAEVNGLLMPVPFNFRSLELLLPQRAAELQTRLLGEFPAGARVPVASLVRSNDRAIRDLGEVVIDTIFRGYTAKQWGRPIEEVDAGVLERVPVTMSRDDRYFRDEFQAIPAAGYTAMVMRMLDHPSITVALGVDGAAEARRRPDARLLWTGRVDSYFEYEFGELPYRSLRFENIRTDRWRQLPVAVVNYPGNEQFTRVIDHSHFASHGGSGSTLTYEYPTAYRAGENEPFYPVSDEASRARYEQYAALADRCDVMFAGRLGDFKYYDMHQAVGRALTLAESTLADRRDPRSLARAARLSG